MKVVLLVLMVMGLRVVGAVSSPLQVTSGGMQPFGVGAEDDDTAQLRVQPTLSPQVTAHAFFIQNATADLQSLNK